MIIDSALRPQDEAGRLAALRRYDILDTPPEQEFEDIVALVKSVFNMPHAAINLIDHDRQWAKAVTGMDGIDCNRDDAFCDHTIRSLDPLTVSDATQDPRFAENPFVTPEDGVRAYLGVPLTSPDGYNIGALCVFGTEPRSFADAEVEVLRNLAKVVMSQMELRLTARMDGLTGAMTRRAFLERLERALKTKAQAPLCLILFDLDHFKSVNDHFGHPAGDEVLRTVAAVVNRMIRKSDAFGRLGGEEFGILLGYSQLEDGVRFAERLQSVMREQNIPEVAGMPVTLSIGASLWQVPESGTDWLARTDRLLYLAKHEGRDRIVTSAR